MKHPTFSAILTLCLASTALGQIAYFDAPSGESGTTQVTSGITAVWQQFDGLEWVDFDDSLSARAFNSGGWELRLTGPAANAADTTAYQVGHSDDAAQIRVILTGFDPSDLVDFFIYNTAAGGVAAIQSTVSTDTTATDLYGGLTPFSSGGTNVLFDGTEGTSGGDQRVRYSASSGLTGSTSYVIVLDDFETSGPGDRATLDGFGVEVTEAGTMPEFGLAPEDYLGEFGDEFSLIYPATGNPAPSYQWQYSPDDFDPWTDLDGETSSTLTIVGAQPEDIGYYRVVASNTTGEATSPFVLVELDYPAPEVSLPASGYGVLGEDFSVTATASGLGALSYEWHRIDDGGDTLLPETGDTLTFSPLTEDDIGNYYYVAVTDDGSGVTPADFPITRYSADFLLLSDPGPIAYFDAPSSDSGTTQENAGVTAVWQQFDGVEWIDFDDSLSSRNFNSGDWELRQTGPGVNAFATTVYASLDTQADAAQIRVVLSGFDPSDVLDFFFYNVSAGGAAKIQSLLSTDTTAEGMYEGLTAFSISNGSETNVEQVLADGTPGDPGSGDRRYRTLAFEGVTGSSSYAFVFDDFDPGSGTPGDRATIDGVGIAGLPPAPGYASWIGGFDVGGMTGFEEDADGDGLKNGLENFFGTDPSTANQGLSNVMRVGNSLMFQHPKNSSPASDLAAAYLWSDDLSTWYADGEENGGTTVTFEAVENTPGPGMATVTATIAGTVPAKVFTKVEVSQTP